MARSPSLKKGADPGVPEETRAQEVGARPRSPAPRRPAQFRAPNAGKREGPGECGLLASSISSPGPAVPRDPPPPTAPQETLTPWRTLRFLRDRLGLPSPVLGLFLVAFSMGDQRLNLYFHLFFVFGGGGGDTLLCSRSYWA